MDVLVLHHHPELLEKCCDLVNAEWPRSRTARMRGLECSCDNLPTSLLLVQRNENIEASVVGHSKISRIPSIPAGGFIESVVIEKNLRGKGLGRLLMLKTEEHMKRLGLREAYLSTYDQQIFYSKLGYEFCERVSIFGSAITFFHEDHSKQDDKATDIRAAPSITNQNIPLPPPPPPFPTRKEPRVISSHHSQSATANGKPKKDFMKKSLVGLVS